MKFPFGLKRASIFVRDFTTSYPNFIVWELFSQVRFPSTWSWLASRICRFRLFPPNCPDGRSTPGRDEFACWSIEDVPASRRSSWISSGRITDVSVVPSWTSRSPSVKPNSGVVTPPTFSAEVTRSS
jgi:hypothetical protein